MALLTYSDSDPGWSASGDRGALSAILAASQALSSRTFFFSLIGFCRPTWYLFCSLTGLFHYCLQTTIANRLTGSYWVFRSLGLFAADRLPQRPCARSMMPGTRVLPQGAGGILGAAIGAGFDQAFQSGWRAPGVGHAFSARAHSFCRYQLAPGH